MISWGNLSPARFASIRGTFANGGPRLGQLRVLSRCARPGIVLRS